MEPGGSARAAASGEELREGLSELEKCELTAK